MNQGRQSFMVGLVTIVALLGLALLLVRFGELDRILHPAYPIQVHTNEAAGLRAGSRVTLNGVRIGSVETINLETGVQFPVRVVAMIDRDYTVPEDATFRINQDLIGGSAVLALAGSGDGTLSTDGRAVLEGPNVTVLEQLSAALTDRFDPLLEAMRSFERLAATYTRVGEEIETLIAEPEDGAPADEASLYSAIVKLNRVLDDTESTLAGARSWLDDEQLREDVRAAAGRVGPMLDQANETIAQFDAVAKDLSKNAAGVEQRLAEVADQASATLQEIRRVATLAAEGDGTAAKLLNDPDLYNSLSDAAARLQTALEQVELLLAKIRAEGLKVDL